MSEPTAVFSMQRTEQYERPVRHKMPKKVAGQVMILN